MRLGLAPAWNLSGRIRGLFSACAGLLGSGGPSPCRRVVKTRMFPRNPQRDTSGVVSCDTRQVSHQRLDSGCFSLKKVFHRMLIFVPEASDDPLARVRDLAPCVCEQSVIEHGDDGGHMPFRAVPMPGDVEGGPDGHGSGSQPEGSVPVVILFRMRMDVVFSVPSPGVVVKVLDHRGQSTARYRYEGPSSLFQYRGKILVSS